MSAFPPPGPDDRAAAPGGGSIEPKYRPVCVLLHLSALAGYLVPLANLIIPLVVWILKKDESETIDVVGREVLNFNISLIVYFLVSWLLAVVLVGFALMVVLYVFGIVVTIIAAVRANDGVRYRYPFTFRLL